MSAADQRAELPVLRALVGPTASGKSSLALTLASRAPIEIISCDSQAIYRGFDVGTAKPSPAEREAVPHHLIDVADPDEDFSAARFVELAEGAMAEIEGRGKIPLLVGGTGLYLRSLLHGIFEGPPKDERLRRALEERASCEGNERLHAELAAVDPEAAARIEVADTMRIVRALEVVKLTGVTITAHHRAHAGRPPRYRPKIVGLTPPRAELYRRVNERGERMFEEGLLDEVKALSSVPGGRARIERIMGYREALAVVEGRASLDDAIGRTRREQRRYAKRQLTWFRGMEEVVWAPWPVDVEWVSKALLGGSRGALGGASGPGRS